MDVGTGYRELHLGEAVELGHECKAKGYDDWHPVSVADHSLGKPYSYWKEHGTTVRTKECKPFTPNKYTRYIPTLDGRKVPVDVYCVLAAFPTGSSAVDHAVKKQLAPGQRGHKDRIQDLKEARDSLTRAIELEEANAP